MKALITRHKKFLARCVFTALMALGCSLVSGQRAGSMVVTPRTFGNVPADIDGSEFHFCPSAIQWEQPWRPRRLGARFWTTDWPEAEHFLTEGISRLTNVDVTKVALYNGEGGERIDLTEDTIFDLPLAIRCRVGRWSLSMEEAAKLRDYLMRRAS